MPKRENLHVKGRKRYRSRILALIRETALSLHATGVMDETVMRKFDDICLSHIRWAKSNAGPTRATGARSLRSAIE